MTDEQLEILVPYVKAKINKSYKPYKYEMNYIDADKQTENLREAVKLLYRSDTAYDYSEFSDEIKRYLEKITGKKYKEIGE